MADNAWWDDDRTRLFAEREVRRRPAKAAAKVQAAPECSCGNPPCPKCAAVHALTGALRAAGRCSICGRPLKDPASIARGVGPDCLAKG